ncbi:HD domain-containing protein [Peptoclostridium litorale DSM 5388]|uniref:HD domain-containing protein n=2 Tax=Peptoclostridium litorale TaxID=1557 RepID=A0A069RIG1_PEPLI|nr:hypothetical protein CLIT_20p00270 [Peptoclostridium litorale DSM 5388]SIO36466.1 HD domain-containing protein [Peptoclostridium litorale DSM 5388]
MISARLIDKKYRKRLEKYTKNNHNETAIKLKLVQNVLVTIKKDQIKNSKDKIRSLINVLKNDIKQLKKNKSKLEDAVNSPWTLYTKKGSKKINAIDEEIKALEKIKKIKDKELKNLSSKKGKKKYENKLAKKAKENYLHSTCVYMIAKEIFTCLNNENDITEELVRYASYFHDAVKVVDKSHNHSRNGHNLFKSLKGISDLNVSLSEEKLDQIAKAIFFHNKREKIDPSNIPNSNILLAQIIHDADKISKLYKSKTWKSSKSNYLSPKQYQKELSKLRKKLILVESENVFENHIKDIHSYI